MKPTRWMLLAMLLFTPVSGAQALLHFKTHADHLTILADEVPVATYVWYDDTIPRPYFCQLATPDGTAITRTHPPDPERDKGNDDHATFHPGLWLAFGDLGSADFWRLKARVRHTNFVAPPLASGNALRFTVRNLYETLDSSAKPLAEETCAYTLLLVENAYLLTLTSTFTALSPDIAFGDQEEMGLGIRLATPLTFKHGNGSILNSAGGRNEEGTWGQPAAWCAASGLIGKQRAGAMLMAAPGNCRPSWFHNRDYGLMVANAFGKKSMTAPKDAAVPPDSTPLSMDAPLVLDYGVYIFRSPDDQEPDYATLYNDYVKRVGGAKLE